MTRQFGIIGYPLTHSFSPAWFKKKFQEQHIDAVYLPYALPAITDFPAWLQANPDIRGLSVTIPYKESIIPYLHEIDDTAAGIGAVNCINITDGKLQGLNTDVIGFEQSLNPLLKPAHTHALVLGTGGSSKAVAWVLKQLGIPYTKVSRTPENGQLSYDELTTAIIASCKLIINTTPLGQYPNPDAAAPIPYDGIGDEHLLFDLVYNPAETKFLASGKARGAGIKNGFEMLQLQAEAAWEIWNK